MPNMQNKSGHISPLKAMTLVHRAMMLGQVIFAAIATVLVSTRAFYPSLQDQERIFQVVALVLCFVGVYIGSTLFRKKISSIRDSNASVNERVDEYKKAAVVQWALLEGPVLFVIISFMLTANYSLLVLAVVLMMVFAAMAPSKAKIVFLLRLNDNEAADV